MTDRRWSFTIPPEAAGKRLDAYLAAAVADTGAAVSRERIKGWIRSGAVEVDGANVSRPSYALAVGQRVVLTAAPPDPAATIQPEEGPVHVVYSDAAIAVVDKPAGVTVHPAAAEPTGTFIQRLAGHFPQLADPQASGMEGQRPGVVHRIDKDTSGLLLVALHEHARRALAEAFADRKVDKEYLALVHGRPETATGEVAAPIGRHPTQKVKMAVVEKGGRPARSRWRVLWSCAEGRCSLLAVRIFTGRTHQIRVHMAHLGHPLLGDRVYGPSVGADPLATSLARRQMLHAWRLGFDHPEDGRRLEFLLPPPRDFLRVALHADRLARSGPGQRVAVTGMPGCGKSAVCALLHENGVPVWSADAAVAALYEPGADGWAYLRGRFGERFAPDSSPVDKQTLFAAMQEDAGVRREVLAAIHPMARAHLERFWKEHAGARLAVAEIPLLFEAEGGEWSDQAADVIVGVYSPPQTRRERLRVSRGWGAQVTAALEGWQWPEEKKMQSCDLIVDNSGDLADLERRTAGLERVLAGLRRAGVRRLRERLTALFNGRDGAVVQGGGATCSR